ncbi:capsular polysaccharide export protein [Rhodobacter sp. JA431]|uniref:capsule biosynthesis protein n=1 Tax=Rhodobacter sp. JA431 TaxID=570013 RepID=UPI000BD7EFC7|nr:capsular biosynthesis protein [Rhodobacter sp. JA431]SOC12734.1 capsular polysaccharide export protein [Rhodobacter sp. JA431]
MTAALARTFLMLQGPHGPFFDQLGQMLRLTGAKVWRVGFNRGDQAFWRDKAHFIRYNGTPEAWPARFAALLDEKAATDLVLYGDTRPIHAQAVAEAKARGITVHVFEEGYLRPYWVTYERGGANGHSRLMRLSLPEMRAALAQSEIDFPDAPPRWGDTRQHIFYGALYHFFVLALNHDYRSFTPHRGISVFDEARIYFKRLFWMPWQALERTLATAKVRLTGHPIHLVLLQLEHDASLRMHSNFQSQAEFIELVAEGFAKGAPRHHHLVFKAHPLEDGRAPLAATIRAATKRHGLAGRVHFIGGGKLAALLAQARSAVTINSTAGQQVLWRGLPLRIFGRAVYDKPEFVSAQPLDAFYAAPARPDTRGYRDYRHYLLETSQVPGGFYAARGRRILLRQVVDMMLSPEDPYDALVAGNAAPRQQLRVVS